MLKVERYSVFVVEHIIGRSRYYGNQCSCDAGERESSFVVEPKVMSAYACDDVQPIGDAVQLTDVELKGLPSDYLGGVRPTWYSEED